MFTKISFIALLSTLFTKMTKLMLGILKIQVTRNQPVYQTGNLLWNHNNRKYFILQIKNIKIILFLFYF